jgi:hypothetical protein
VKNIQAISQEKTEQTNCLKRKSGSASRLQQSRKEKEEIHFLLQIIYNVTTDR